MGCDIHLHTEIKIDRQWHHYSKPMIQRNYRLFGLMAGVRDSFIEPVCYPKGLPDKLTFTTWFCNDVRTGDAHSHSWFNAEELEIFYDRLIEVFEDERRVDMHFIHKQAGYLFGNDWGAWLQYPHSYPKAIEDIRWIFWFDN